MQNIVGITLVVLGSVLVTLGPRLVRHQAKLHFSGEDLAATSGLHHRRVQLWKLTGVIANDTVGGLLVYMGIRFLIS